MKTLLVLEVKCPFCGESTAVEVFESDYNAWKCGTLAQEAFPYLNADEREVLISGICPDCWEKMFA